MLNVATRLFFVTLTTLVFAVSASAADWYRVEIVIFANTEAGADAEAWPTDIDELAQHDARQLASPGSGEAFARLADSELKLGGVVNALRSAGSRRPLLHLGWRQPVLERGKAEPLWIQGGPRRYLADGRAVDEIAGTLLLTRSRFLHVWTDLRYAESGFEGAVYRMQDHRRMRSGELHYIDHPTFGLLILCTPIQAGG